MRISDWSSDVCSSDLRPGTSALATADEIIATMERLKQDFPPGLDYDVVYNLTQFIAESNDAVYETLFEAMLLVVLVVLVFLQSWRTALIPIVAIPVSLIGTFAVMAAFGRLEAHTSELQSLM